MWCCWRINVPFYGNVSFNIKFPGGCPHAHTRRCYQHIMIIIHLKQCMIHNNTGALYALFVHIIFCWRQMHINIIYIYRNVNHIIRGMDSGKYLPYWKCNNCYTCELLIFGSRWCHNFFLISTILKNKKYDSTIAKISFYSLWFRLCK